MSYSMGDVRRWEPAALVEAAGAVASRASAAAESRRALVEGGEELDEGWDGRAAEAVLDAVVGERSHVNRLEGGLEDLVDALARAHDALGPAVQAVRDRVSDAESAGLVVSDVAVEPAAGRAGSGPGAAAGQVNLQMLVDLHAEAIGSSLVTVRSLDEHYGREIDEIAARLHSAIPPEVDRSPIPGPDDPWPGRAVDAMTGAMRDGNPAVAHDLDPETRGRHKLNPAPDDFGRAASTGLRGLGRVTGPLGAGLTVYDGVKAHAEGETTTAEAVVETGGALVGGMAGGAAAGAVAGSFLGPVGTFIGAGVGAAVGTYLGQKTGDAVHGEFISERWEG